jgi:peroxiredoxin
VLGSAGRGRVPSSAMDDPSTPPESGTVILPPEDLAPVRSRPPVPRGLLWALALAVVVLTIASWMALSPAPSASGPGAPDGPPTAVDVTGQQVPDVRFEILDGQPSSLSDLRGSPVVVNFWSTTCPPCITEMPAFEQVHQAYGDRVRFLGLAPDNESTARAQQRRTGVSYPLGFDPESQIAKTFGVITIPATVLIDRDGTIVHVSQGPALTAPSLTGLIAAKLRP